MGYTLTARHKHREIEPMGNRCVHYLCAEQSDHPAPRRALLPQNTAPARRQWAGEWSMRAMPSTMRWQGRARRLIHRALRQAAMEVRLRIVGGQLVDH